MRYYNIKDIKEFLETKYAGLEWNGDIIDTSCKYRKASDNDLENDYIMLRANLTKDGETHEELISVSPSNTLFVINESYPVKLHLTFFDKIVLGENGTTSQDWVELLLKNHKDEYAKFLAELATSKKKQIREKAQKDIETKIKSITKEADKECEFYDQYLKKANKYLEKNSNELGKE